MTPDLGAVDLLTRYRAARRFVLPDCLTVDDRAALLWVVVSSGNGQPPDHLHQMSQASGVQGLNGHGHGHAAGAQLVLFGEVER